MTLKDFCNRREFIGGGCAIAFLSACHKTGKTAPRQGKVEIDYPKNIPIGITVYPVQRVALIKDSKGIGALSMLCTHQSCLIQKDLKEEGGFVCPCHGARFSLTGKVLAGPAPSDLTWHKLNHLENDMLQADFSVIVDEKWRLPIT